MTPGREEAEVTLSEVKEGVAESFAYDEGDQGTRLLSEHRVSRDGLDLRLVHLVF